MARERVVSAFNSWVASGGTLRCTLRYRRKHEELFPYINTTDAHPIGLQLSSLMPVVSLVALVMLIVKLLGMGSPAPVTGSDVTLQIGSVTSLDVTQDASLVDTSLLPASEAVALPALPMLQGSLSAALDYTSYYDVPTLAADEMPKEAALRVGWFWPSLRGTHCRQQDCYSMRLADGSWYLDHINEAAACPVEFSLGAVLDIPGVGLFVCRHRLPVTICHGAVCDVAVLGHEDIGAWPAIHKAYVLDRGAG